MNGIQWATLKVRLPQFLYFSSFSRVYEEAVLHFTPSWRFYVEWCLFFVLFYNFSMGAEPLKVKQANGVNT